MNKVVVKPGFEGTIVVPHSEVCMHMRIAGKTMKFRVEDRGNNPPAVQFLKEDGTPFSFPVLYGEGGLFYDENTKEYYFYSP